MNQPIKLDGKTLADSILEHLKKEVEVFQNASYDLYRTSAVPTLSVFMIGNHPASIKYTRMKREAAERIGMSCINIDLPESVPAPEVLQRIEGQNKLSGIHGIMLQHPVPERLMSLEREFFDTINPKKDVDGTHTLNFGKLSVSESPLSFRPATPKGIITLLDHYNIPLKGKVVTIVGSSNILGLPLSIMMHRRGATVSICNKETDVVALINLCCISDIIVGACGVPGLIKEPWVKRGAVLIDAGCSPGNVGDIVPEAYGKASYYTPVPGGVGPMTIATLLSQTLQAAKESRREDYRR